MRKCSEADEIGGKRLNNWPCSQAKGGYVAFNLKFKQCKD